MGKINLWAVIYVTVMMIVEVGSSTLHRVGGGRYTWNVNVNFSDWTTHERFYSGDWLYFGFDPTSHSVLQVNKNSYEQCMDTDFISNVTRGGRDVFQLLEPKTYYFICGRGSCHQGMKLAVNVLPQTTPSTPTVLSQPPPSTPTIPFTFASTATTFIPSRAFSAVVMAILTFAFKVSYFD